jgi:hypothetical protein
MPTVSAKSDSRRLCVARPSASRPQPDIPVMLLPSPLESEGKFGVTWHMTFR